MRRTWMPALAGLVLAGGCRGGRRPTVAASDSAHAHAAAVPGAAADSAAVAARPLAVSQAERFRLGIMMTPASARELIREVRLAGRVAPAETAQRTVTTRVDGFVDQLHVDFTGRMVRRGEPLLELYSPLLVSAQQELLLAVHLRSSLGADPSGEAARNADSLVAAARRRLRYWEISDDQIAELERTGSVRRTLTLHAPSDGIVLQKNVIQGQSVMAGAALFQIADLRIVWLEADVFESDLALMHTGLHALVTFDAYPGQPFHGGVTYVYPTVDPASRTGRVRIEVPNGEGRIKPGLFGTALITASVGPRTVVIPRQAALVTGDRATVFVEDSLGRLVPRAVTLGAETDSLVQVLSGLRSGERLVAAAAFLLDAETNLGAAMAGMAGMDMGGASKTPAPAGAPAGASPHTAHTPPRN
jgi:Cu(I)/Ag(I) efflux system membrane fusion protein